MPTPPAPSDTSVRPKVKAAGVSGALTVLVVYIAGLLGLDLPAEVASAFTTVTAFAVAYLRRD